MKQKVGCVFLLQDSLQPGLRTKMRRKWFPPPADPMATAPPKILVQSHPLRSEPYSRPLNGAAAPTRGPPLRARTKAGHQKKAKRGRAARAHPYCQQMGNN